MIIEFQHLDTQSPRNAITLFGRTTDDKSVAVHVAGFRPSLYIRLDTTKVESLQERINAALIRYSTSKRIFKNEKEQTGTITNIQQALKGKPAAYFEVVDGQDITDFREKHTPKFLKISTVDKWKFNDLKAILTRKCDFIGRQSVMKFDNKLKCNEMVEMTAKRGNIGEVINEKHRAYMLDRPHTIYNEQVDYGLQYLIDRDIYSCSWMQIEGSEVEAKTTYCDIELNAINWVNTHKQIDRDDVAPWHVLSYDIESVPHPRGNGKYDFPGADLDPVCTIGAVVQINESVKKYVFIHSPNGDPLDKLTPIAEPLDAYNSDDVKVFHFDDELDMLDSFNKFIIEQDIDIIEGYNTALFDHPYLFDRYHVLNNGGYPSWGRFIGVESFIKKRFLRANKQAKMLLKLCTAPAALTTMRIR